MMCIPLWRCRFVLVVNKKKGRRRRSRGEHNFHWEPLCRNLNDNTQVNGWVLFFFLFSLNKSRWCPVCFSPYVRKETLVSLFEISCAPEFARWGSCVTTSSSCFLFLASSSAYSLVLLLWLTKRTAASRELFSRPDHFVANGLERNSLSLYSLSTRFSTTHEASHTKKKQLCVASQPKKKERKKKSSFCFSIDHLVWPFFFNENSNQRVPIQDSNRAHTYVFNAPPNHL